MDHEEVNPAELTAWFSGVVAEYSQPDQLAMRLAAVKLVAAQRIVARQVVTSPAGGLLFRHACVEIARHFRRNDSSALTLREVSAQTGIPLTDARAALRAFVNADILVETVEPPDRRDAPPMRRYRLADGGGSLAAEVAIQAEAAKGSFAVRVEGLGWQS